MRLPEPYTFFVDRCLGTGDVCDVLRASGINIVVHDDVFGQRTDDVEWNVIELAARDAADPDSDGALNRWPQLGRAAL